MVKNSRTLPVLGLVLLLAFACDYNQPSGARAPSPATKSALLSTDMFMLLEYLSLLEPPEHPLVIDGTVRISGPHRTMSACANNQVCVLKVCDGDVEWRLWLFNCDWQSASEALSHVDRNTAYRFVGTTSDRFPRIDGFVLAILQDDEFVYLSRRSLQDSLRSHDILVPGGPFLP